MRRLPPLGIQPEAILGPDRKGPPLIQMKWEALASQDKTTSSLGLATEVRVGATSAKVFSNRSGVGSMSL